MTLTGRDLPREPDLSDAESAGLIDLAAQLKADRRAGREETRLAGKVIALIGGSGLWTLTRRSPAGVTGQVMRRMPKTKIYRVWRDWTA